MKVYKNDEAIGLTEDAAKSIWLYNRTKEERVEGLTILINNLIVTKDEIARGLSYSQVFEDYDEGFPEEPPLKSI